VESDLNLILEKQKGRICAADCCKKDILVSIAGYFAAVIQAKDDLTGQHSLQVASLMANFARHIGLSADKVFLAHLAGILHDLGKVCIAEHILTKPQKLTLEEMSQMRKHPAMGANILARIKGFNIIAQAVRHHHEKYDGTGYPCRLEGEDIPLLSRMLTLCDSFDAMTSMRHYRTTYTMAKAIGEIKLGEGRQFDPNLSKAFVAYIMQKEIC
jgi:putative nucleotidyltransferase with HDIG domain